MSAFLERRDSSWHYQNSSPICMFSNRTNWPHSSNQLISLFEDYQKQGMDIVNLTESNPLCCEFRLPFQELLRFFDNHNNFSYSPAAHGQLNACQAVCRYYQKKGIKINPENIFLTASTSESYGALFRLLCNPGDRALIAKPGYPLFECLSRIHDVGLDYYGLEFKNAWRIDFSELENSIDDRLKMLIVVNPNNPTGSFLTASEVVRLSEIARYNNVALICDEVFLDYAYDDSFQTLSLASNVECLTFTLSGISKCLAMPQMKCGWMILSGPKERAAEAKRRLEIILDSTLSIGTPVQNALDGWFGFMQDIQKEIRTRLKDNLEFLKQSLEGSGCRSLNGKGGWYAVIRLPDTVDEDKLCLKLLTADGVFMYPGYFFDCEGFQAVIVSLLCPIANFQRGIRALIHQVNGHL